MKTKSIFILLSCLISCNRANTARESAMQTVQLLENEKQLGDISNNKLVELEVKFQNSYGNDVSIDNFQGSCGCTDIKMVSKAIKAKSTARVSVVYDPKEDVGETKKKVVFRLSNGQLLVYTFTANVIKE